MSLIVERVEEINLGRHTAPEIIRGPRAGPKPVR